MLIGVFGFVALQAVILNKAIGLIVVLTALPARLISVPYSDLALYWYVVANVLAGSLVGAWVGATWATRMRSSTLCKVIAVLLVFIAAALAVTHLTAVGSAAGFHRGHLVGVADEEQLRTGDGGLGGELVEDERAGHAAFVDDQQLTEGASSTG